MISVRSCAVHRMLYCAHAATLSLLYCQSSVPCCIVSSNAINTKIIEEHPYTCSVILSCHITNTTTDGAKLGSIMDDVKVRVKKGRILTANNTRPPSRPSNYVRRIQLELLLANQWMLSVRMHIVVPHRKQNTYVQHQGTRIVGTWCVHALHTVHANSACTPSLYSTDLNIVSRRSSSCHGCHRVKWAARHGHQLLHENRAQPKSLPLCAHSAAFRGGASAHKQYTRSRATH